VALGDRPAVLDRERAESGGLNVLGPVVARERLGGPAATFGVLVMPIVLIAVAARALVHVAFVDTSAVEPASAEPVTSGNLSFAGDTGEVASELGALGAVKSST